MRISVKHSQQEMAAYKRSLNNALANRPVSDSPTLAAFFGDLPHLLAAIDAYVATLDEYHPFKQARKDVIQYQRSHPDIDGFRDILGVSDEWVDQLFLDAMRFEGTL